MKSITQMTLVLLALGAGLVAGGCRAATPSDHIRASGNVEATEVLISPQVGGRMDELKVAEGDRVVVGQVVAQLDTTDTRLALRRARADRDQAAAQLALLLAGSRAEDIRQAEAQVKAAEADASGAKDDAASAETDFVRFDTLLKSNSGSQKQRDDAATRRDLARARLRAADEQVQAAREVLVRLQRGARPEEIAAAMAHVAAADAQIATLEQNIKDATVVAPIGGLVTQKLADAGEILAPRTPIVTIADLDNAWANIYIDEPAVPRVRVGQPATVFTDAGGPGLPGKVTFVSSKAEFTPRNVQTSEERIQARVPHQGHGGQPPERAQTGDARRSGRAAGQVGVFLAARDATAARRSLGLAGRRMDSPAVTLNAVTKRFGPTVAVNAVSLEIRRGEMFGLIGPDGAGKTTTIRLICGLLRPDGGQIAVLGHDPVRQHAAITKSAGYLSQRFSLYGDLSIDENIAFFAEIHGLTDYERRRDRLLDMTQLTPFRHRLADRLSGGMKQKLALACTLVHEPEIILLDEPTTGVDPVSRREFWKLLSEFLAQGITIVMATPYLDEAERCTRVALLSGGRLLVADSPAKLRQSLPGVVVEVIAHPPARAIEALSQIPGIDLQRFGERVHARWADREADGAMSVVDGALRAAGVEVVSVRQIQASLEDVFIYRVTEAPGNGRNV